MPDKTSSRIHIDTDAHPYVRMTLGGVVLPPARTPIANYVPALQHGGLLYVSGHGPVEADGRRHSGKVGENVTVEDAYLHARLTGLNVLATMEAALGSLSRVTRILKVLGMVNSTAEFKSHPKVIDGCSDLLVEVFGEEIGRHTRSAIGVGSLPGQITVEVELVAAFMD